MAEETRSLGMILLRCLASSLELKDREELVNYHTRILGNTTEVYIRLCVTPIPVHRGCKDIVERLFLTGSGNASKIRSLFYPPIPEQVPAGAIRCGEHSDYGTITFLFQDHLGGLEVRAVDGSWVQAEPVKVQRQGFL